MSLYNLKENKLETSSFIKSLEFYPPAVKMQILQEVRMAVFVACNLKKDFTASELFGGSSWKGLNINLLFNYYLLQGKDEETAKKLSGSDIGKVLKKVLVEHEQEFELLENDSEEFRGRFNPNVYRLKK